MLVQASGDAAVPMDDACAEVVHGRAVGDNAKAGAFPLAPACLRTSINFVLYYSPGMDCTAACLLVATP